MKILFVNNNMFGLNIFRGDIIKKLKNEGYDIKTCSPIGEINMLEEFGIPHFPIELEARGMNILKDLKYFYSLYKIYRKEKSDLIFHYTIKPNIYGTIAAKLNGIKSIAVLAGLGQMFSKNNIQAKIARGLYKFSLRFCEEVWLLNEDDREKVIELNIVHRNKTFVLPGEGVNTNKYMPLSKLKKENKIKFLMIARILWDKGFKEYAEVAKILKRKYNYLEFQLLGATAENDSMGVPLKVIESYLEDGTLNYLGTTNQVKEIIREVDCVVLPSFYREGMPMVLLEAASMEKVIITTDNVGCKDTVINGYNGFLCRVKSVEDLQEKIEKFLKLSNKDKKIMGQNSRILIKEKYDIEIIKNIYIEKIKKIIEGKKNERSK